MTDTPHVHMDITAALAGRPSITTTVATITGRLDAEQALALSEDIRSAALVAAQLANERDHERSYRKPGTTVIHGDPANLTGAD